MDALFFILPAFFSLSLLVAGIAQSSALYILIGTAFIDSGHVYTTIWRTILHPDERRSSRMYALVPFAVALFFCLWSYSNIPYMWNFVIYATLHHNIRQFYGITRWYQTLNKRASPWNTKFFYALTLLPVLAFHFRPGAAGGFYAPNDLFLFPDKFIYQFVTVYYLIHLAGWISYELYLLKTGIREWNRLSAMATALAVYGVTFFFAENVIQILLPLVFAHGIAYFGLMGLALNRTRTSQFPRFVKAIAIIVVTAIAFGALEAYIEEHWVGFGRTDLSIYEALIIGLYLVPVFSHFIFDAFIWKKAHREGHLIYQRSTTT